MLYNPLLLLSDGRCIRMILYYGSFAMEMRVSSLDFVGIAKYCFLSVRDLITDPDFNHHVLASQAAWHVWLTKATP